MFVGVIDAQALCYELGVLYNMIGCECKDFEVQNTNFLLRYDLIWALINTILKCTDVESLMFKDCQLPKDLDSVSCVVTPTEK